MPRRSLMRVALGFCLRLFCLLKLEDTRVGLIYRCRRPYFRSHYKTYRQARLPNRYIPKREVMEMSAVGDDFDGPRHAIK